VINFLHPWAIFLGAAAVALPIAIHLLTKPRPVRMPLSTIRFVRAAVRQRRARSRLRDIIILSLRALAVFLLAAAVSRPLLGKPQLIAADDSTHSARVVLLDVSQSLAAQHRGVRLFERARSVAAGYLGEQPGSQADLILAGATARPAFTRLTTNFAALRDELSHAQVRPERLNVAAAINQAAELLAKSGGDGVKRELVIVSDFQRTNWAAADFAPLPADTKIQLDSVAPTEPLPNLAILRVTGPPRVEPGRDVHVEVEIGNFSPTPRRVQAEVSLNESVVRLDGTCPPSGRITLAADVPLRGAGWQVGQVRLIDNQDALLSDDVRPFVLEARPAPTFALVTQFAPRESRGAKYSGGYYLERALSPLEPRPGRTEIKVQRIAPDQFARETVNDIDALVLDHPGQLSTTAIQLLANLLRRGRGVMYVAAEPADATNLQRLAEACGSDLQLPVEFAPPPAGQRRRDLFLAEVRKDLPPFTVFGESVPQVTGSLRFAGGLTTRRKEGALADDVLATFSDRTAALVVTPCGEGVLAVLNVDLGASNLPQSPAFVPLVGELATRLLGKPRETGARPCGEPLAVRLPAAAGPAAGLKINPPAGEIIEEGGGVLWRCPLLEAPGVYQVKRGDAVVYAIAAAVPPEESDLRPLDPAVLTERLAGGRQVTYRAATGDGEEQQDRMWTWLAVACVGCLLGEVVALKMFRT
jgi:hypothetical protein